MLEAAWAAKAMEAPAPPPTRLRLLLVVGASVRVLSRETGDRADEGSEEALAVLGGVQYLLSCGSVRDVAESCLGPWCGFGCRPAVGIQSG